jgi:hypothetical protein
MNYEDFYSGVQAYSVEMLRLVSGVRNSAMIMRRVTYAMIEEAGYSHIVAIWKQANYVDERSTQIVERARRVFWARDIGEVADVETFHAMNQMRWQPYDETAWLGITSELSGVLLPWLRDIEPPVERQNELITAEIEAWLRFGIPDKLRQIKQVNTNTRRNCARVRKSLQPQVQRQFLRVV